MCSFEICEEKPERKALEGSHGQGWLFFPALSCRSFLGPSSVCLRSSGSGIPFNSNHPPKHLLNTGLCPRGRRQTHLIRCLGAHRAQQVLGPASLSVQVGCAMCQQSMQKSVLAFHEVRIKCGSSFTGAATLGGGRGRKGR